MTENNKGKSFQSPDGMITDLEPHYSDMTSVFTDCQFEFDELGSGELKPPTTKIPKFFNSITGTKKLKAFSDPASLTPKITLRRPPLLLGATPKNLCSLKDLPKSVRSPTPSAPLADSIPAFCNISIPCKTEIGKRSTNHLIHLARPSPKPEISGSLSASTKNEEGSSVVMSDINFIDILLKAKVDRPMLVNRKEFLRSVHKEEKFKPSILKKTENLKDNIYTVPDENEDSINKKVRFCDNMIVIEYNNRQSPKRSKK